MTTKLSQNTPNGLQNSIGHKTDQNFPFQGFPKITQTVFFI
jgi:hypothetical protein